MYTKYVKTGFRNLKYAKIKQVLVFKQVSVTCVNILNRKNKKQEKNSFQNLPEHSTSPLSFFCGVDPPSDLVSNPSK